MATVPREPKRDPDDDAKARAWADRARGDAEAGKLADDADYLARRLAEEKRKHQPS
jgi:hypothetical protein